MSCKYMDYWGCKTCKYPTDEQKCDLFLSKKKEAKQKAMGAKGQKRIIQFPPKRDEEVKIDQETRIKIRCNSCTIHNASCFLTCDDYEKEMCKKAQAILNV